MFVDYVTLAAFEIFEVSTLVVMSGLVIRCLADSDVIDCRWMALLSIVALVMLFVLGACIMCAQKVR